MKKKIQFQIRNTYLLEAIGLLIVVAMLFGMGMAPHSSEAITIDTASVDQSSDEVQLLTDLSVNNPLQVDSVTHFETSMIRGSSSYISFQTLTNNTVDPMFNTIMIEDNSQVSEIEDVSAENEGEEVLEYSSIISLDGYDNVWISPDGKYAYRFHTGDWNDVKQGNVDGMTVEPWALDILYDVWSQYPNLVDFDHLLGLIMKESNGRYDLSIIDTNGERSSGMLQYNNWAGKMDGQSMAIIKNNSIPQVLLGKQARDARDNNPNCVWFTESWDAKDVQMMIERWCIFNSILHDNGWSQQKTILAHRYGAYSKSLNNSSLQNSEWAAVEGKIRTYVTPYRLI